MEIEFVICQLIIFFLPVAAYFKSVKFRRAADNAEKFLGKTRDGAFIIFCFLFMFFASIFILCEGHHWGGDFSLYLAQARAVASGDVNSWLEKQTFIISHSTPGFSPLMYPWGTALILAPIYALFGLNLYAFKLASVFLLAAAWAIFFCFLRLKENFTTAASLVAILMFNANYLFSVDNIMSEFPFLFFSMAAIFFFYKRKSAANFKLYGVLIGVAIFFSVNTRTLGVALLAALILEDIFTLKNFPLKKSAMKKIFPYSAPYLTYGILSAIFSRLLPQIAIQDNAGYLVTFSFKPLDILAQAFYYFETLGTFFLPNLKLIYYNGAEHSLYLLAAILIGALAIFGAIKNFAEDRFLIFYIAFTFAIISAFTAQTGFRYMFGIIPFIVRFAYIGIKNFRPKKFVAISLLTTSLIFSAAAIIIFHAEGRDTNQAYTAAAIETYDFIKKNIPADKVIFFSKPRVLYLNTNVYSYYLLEDEEKSLRWADYVLFKKIDYYPSVAELVKHDKKYVHVYGNEEFNLYQIRKENNFGLDKNSRGSRP